MDDASAHSGADCPIRVIPRELCREMFVKKLQIVARGGSVNAIVKVKVLFAITMQILACTTHMAFSQTASTGALTGTTSDATPAVIPGVQITITNEATRETRSMISNENGDSF